MIHLPEIWDYIRARLPRSQWVALDIIYGLVETHLVLDHEDFEPQAPGSDVPKWKRNVRNVLQYRKKTGEIEWDGRSSYRLLAVLFSSKRLCPRFNPLLHRTHWRAARR